MKRYAIPIVFAWVALWLTLHTSAAYGWRVVPTTDAYLGYTSALVSGEGYRQCASAGYIACEYGDWANSHDLAPTAYRLPVYPLFLAPFVASGYDDPLPTIRLAQCILAAALVCLTSAYASRLRGQFAGVIAGAALLTVGGVYEYAATPITEMLYSVLLIILVHYLTWRAWRGLTIGVLVGVLLLTRGTLLLTVPLLFAFVPRRHWLLFALGIALIVGSWAARNIAVGLPTVFSTGGGHVIYGANNPQAYARADGYWLYAIRLPGWERYAGLGEVEQDAALQRDAIAFIRSQDIGTLLNVARAKLTLLVGDSALVYVLLALTALSLPRLLRTRRRWYRSRALWLALALWAGLLINTAVFWGDSRFLFPLTPTLAIGIGVTLSALIRRGEPRKQREQRTLVVRIVEK